MNAKRILPLILVVAAGCGGPLESTTGTVTSAPELQASSTDLKARASKATFTPLVDTGLQLLVTPGTAGHTPIVDAINDAKSSVYMTMYRITDTTVVQALIGAYQRGVTVKVILDQSSLSSSGYAAAYNSLKAAGVDVIKSSTGFSITHEKSMVIDKKTAFITSMNMTNPWPTTRDFGVVTTNSTVIKEWLSVFNEDVTNAKYGEANTPTLSDPSLVWSPVNSETRLVALINSAKSTIDATVESIDDTNIIAAFDAAEKRGVTVRFITPECVQNPNPLLNYPSLSTMASHNVNVRVMPYPPTTSAPYMHSKMILVDGDVAFVGSVNYTENSTQSAREAGIIFRNSEATSTIEADFQSDWNAAVDVPAELPTFCPAVS